MLMLSQTPERVRTRRIPNEIPAVTAQCADAILILCLLAHLVHFTTGHMSPASECPEPPPQDALNQHVEENRGITSINHSLAHLKRKELTEEERMAAVERKAVELIAEKGSGSKPIEVGFPQDRHGFDL